LLGVVFRLFRCDFRSVFFLVVRQSTPWLPLCVSMDVSATQVDLKPVIQDAPRIFDFLCVLSMFGASFELDACICWYWLFYGPLCCPLMSVISMIFVFARIFLCLCLLSYVLALWVTGFPVWWSLWCEGSLCDFDCWVVALCEGGKRWFVFVASPFVVSVLLSLWCQCLCACVLRNVDWATAHEKKGSVVW